jgi:hypothetical protein
MDERKKGSKGRKLEFDQRMLTPSSPSTGTRFLISKFLITKFLITLFLITVFLSNKVPKLQNS